MIIIGEKINASIPIIKKAIREHDDEKLQHIAMEQEKSGAGCIDINVGCGDTTADREIEDMQWLVHNLTPAIEGQLCIDSADPSVLEAGVKAGKERVGFINSVKATDKSIEEILPLAAHYKGAVIALAMNEKGIPQNVSSRVQACEKIVTCGENMGIAPERFYFDPLVMPLSADTSQGIITLETLGAIKKEFPQSKTVLALSNISFGLPRRSLINTALLHMAMYLGVDAMIMDTLDTSLMVALRAGNVVVGKDRRCRKYSRGLREASINNGGSPC
ncbi:MAG: dihydropteroate synthase [bacterium]